MKTVLFACVHNAGRSQMACAWFNALADSEKARGISAGTQPGAHVHPEVLKAMLEVGVDLSDIKPTLLTPDLAQTANLLITMGCGASKRVANSQKLMLSIYEIHFLHDRCPASALPQVKPALTCLAFNVWIGPLRTQR